MGSIIVLILQLISSGVSLWAKDQKTKDEWAAAVKRARDKYNSEGAGQPAEMKKDYDDLQKDLKDGKYKI
jgi:hypothetical protein